MIELLIVYSVLLSMYALALTLAYNERQAFWKGVKYEQKKANLKGAQAKKR